MLIAVFFSAKSDHFYYLLSTVVNIPMANDLWQNRKNGHRSVGFIKQRLSLSEMALKHWIVTESRRRGNLASGRSPVLTADILLQKQMFKLKYVSFVVTKFSRMQAAEKSGLPTSIPLDKSQPIRAFSFPYYYYVNYTCTFVGFHTRPFTRNVKQCRRTSADDVIWIRLEQPVGLWRLQ